MTNDEKWSMRVMPSAGRLAGGKTRLRDQGETTEPQQRGNDRRGKIWPARVSVTCAARSIKFQIWFLLQKCSKVAAPASRLADKKKFGAIFSVQFLVSSRTTWKQKNKLANFLFGNFWESTHLQNIQISHKKISLHKLGCSCNNILGFISILF